MPRRGLPSLVPQPSFKPVKQSLTVLILPEKKNVVLPPSGRNPTPIEDFVHSVETSTRSSVPDNDLYAEPVVGLSELDAELKWYDSYPILHDVARCAFRW